MKKVAHLTSVHRRNDTRIVERECASLRKHGYDVTLIVNDDKGNETLPNGIKIVSTGFVPNGRLQRMTEGVNRVYEKAIKVNADIYHLHDPELLRIALRLKGRGKKVIFDSHEIYGEMIKAKSWIPRRGRGIISKAYNVYETYVSQRIDGVIDTAKYGGKDWFYNRSRRFVYVGNYPQMSEFKSTIIPSYSQRGGCCFSGGISRDRGVFTILDAVKMAKTHLVLAGKFESNNLQEEFENRDLEHNSSYVGYLKIAELFALYAQCAIGICVMPDNGGQRIKSESFNTKVYDYMAMEMPVILSDWPYRRMMINKYHFGLVANPSDVEDIAAKIKWLVDHPKEAEEMGKNGKRLLEEQFTWEVAEKELLKLYYEIENDEG